MKIKAEKRAGTKDAVMLQKQHEDFMRRNRLVLGVRQNEEMTVARDSTYWRLCEVQQAAGPSVPATRIQSCAVLEGRQKTRDLGLEAEPLENS